MTRVSCILNLDKVLQIQSLDMSEILSGGATLLLL